MQHKWHKEIKAWADGAEIEVRAYKLDEVCSTWSEWKKCDNPFDWERIGVEFRIKPQPKEPQYLYAYLSKKAVIEFCTIDGHVDGYEYLGKIKLEVDDEVPKV